MYTCWNNDFPKKYRHMIKLRGVNPRFWATCSGDSVIQGPYTDYQGITVQEKEVYDKYIGYYKYVLRFCRTLSAFSVVATGQARPMEGLEDNYTKLLCNIIMSSHMHNGLQYEWIWYWFRNLEWQGTRLSQEWLIVMIHQILIHRHWRWTAGWNQLTASIRTKSIITGLTYTANNFGRISSDLQWL
jgi:hypothetical protein